MTFWNFNMSLSFLCLHISHTGCSFLAFFVFFFFFFLSLSQVASGQQEGERLAIAGLQPGLPITTPFITGAHLPSYLAASAMEREGGSAHNPLLQHMALLEQSQNPLVSGMYFTLWLGSYLPLSYMHDGFHTSHAHLKK